MQKVVSTKNFLFIILITLFSSSCRHNNQSLNSTLSSDSLYAICERLAMQLQTDSLREMAQAYIKKTTPYSRDYFKAYQFQLLADFNAKKFDKVIESIEKAYTIPSFETFPDMAGHYQFTYARSLQYSGRSNEAIEAFKKCLNFESIDEVEKESLRIVSLNAMLQLMNTYLSNGQAEESVAFFTNLNNHPTPFIQMYNLRDVRTLLAYSLYYTDNMELAEQMIEEALSTPAYLQTPEGDFRDYSYAAAIFYGNPEKQEKVIDYCLKAIDAAKAYGHTIGQQWTTTLLGKVYHRTGKIQEAIELYKQSANTAKENEDAKGEANAYKAMADLYLHWEQFNQANEYATIALNNSLNHSIKNAVLCGEAYLMKGQVMAKMELADSAIYFWQKADSCFVNVPYTTGAIGVDKQLGTFLIDTNSEHSLQEGIDRMKRVLTSSAWYDRAPSYFQLAKGYIKQGKTREGEMMLDSMYTILHISSTPFYLEDANRFALQYYLNKHDSKNIERFANSYLQETQTKFDSHVAKKVTEAMIEYQTERKEQQLQLAEAKLTQKELSIKLYIVITIGLIVLLLGSILWYIYKRRLYDMKHQLIEQRCKQLLEDVHEANEHSQQVETQLTELLTDKESRLEIASVTPKLFRKSDEGKFRERFTQLYPSFLIKLKELIPTITPNEEILCMLIVLGQTTDQMADILCIARNSVNMARHRLRQKMKLNKEESLEDIIHNLLNKDINTTPFTNDI